MDSFALGLICGFARQNSKAGGVTRLIGAQTRVKRKLERGQLVAELLAS